MGDVLVHPEGYQGRRCRLRWSDEATTDSAAKL